VRPNLDFADEVAIPAASRILGKVARLDPTGDIAMLPEPDLVAVEANHGASKDDRLVLGGYPTEGPLVREPRPATMYSSPTP
jgi:hypothetical protein